MARTSLGTLRAGMVVGEEVPDPAGGTLIPAGTALSDRDLKRLRTWGVTHIEIVDGLPASTEDDLPREVVEAIRNRFRFTDLEHPLLRQLFAHALERARTRGLP